MSRRAVWVVAELDEDGIRESTLEVLAEGRELADRLQDTLGCVLIGSEVGRFVKVLGRYGADVVYLSEDPALSDYTTDGYVGALTGLVMEYHPFLVMLSATPSGQDLAPRVAARLKTGLVTDCVAVKVDAEADLEFIKPTHQGRIYSTIACIEAEPRIVTLRPGVFGSSPPGPDKETQVITFRPRIEGSTLRTKVRGLVKGDPKLIPLEEANIIVAGGRGVTDGHQWHEVEQVAEALRGAVGGTRVALDMGIIARDRMIGQTGKSVRPTLYLAAGISGASHHIGGVDAEHLVAINTDRNAPIMKRSELGIVANAKEVLPLLLRSLRQLSPERD